MSLSELMLKGLADEYGSIDADREREMQARLRAAAAKTDRDIELLVRDARRDPTAWRAAHLLATSSRSNQLLTEFMSDAIRCRISPPKQVRADSALIQESRDMAIVLTIQQLLDEGYQLSKNEATSYGQSACCLVADALKTIEAKRVHEIWKSRASLPWT
ncbi:hypothetical protein [Halomonas sp.]|uniref:hypothetical protein n=1 Tax=Halomonas sp. TaxID=1486246 RepID=UPI003A908059